jgi:mannosyltransferase OCH1-like enzyme
MKKWLYALLFIVGLVVLSEYGLSQKESENFDIKNEIPLNIFQTWSTKDLPVHMKNNVDKLQKQNPEFKYHLFDDDDCREYISKHFDESVLNAYDKLIPGAYKADLWRYCVLYKQGGIYLDKKMRCVSDFKLIEVVDQEHYVRDVDIPYNIEKHSIGIYNAVMIQKKNNPFLMECIQQIVKNVNSNYYGFSALYPTGPGMLGELYTKYKYDYRLANIDMFHIIEGEKIIYNERIILEHYPEYRKEQLINQKELHYSILWKNGSIYLL